MRRSSVVTGGARGIGRAVAARLLRDGATVVVLDRDPPEQPADGPVSVTGDTAAKAAVGGLTRALAVDAGPSGIRVDAVALGSVDTARHRTLLAGQDPEQAARTEAQMAALHPLGRVGTPEEVAEAVTSLLSDAAAFVTGVVLPVDGGRAVRGADPGEA
ncbi:SDR family NAD(P)-dependent oxidoreductase [Geodermatophilus amargosae]|uniref:SDR family NAD(P)-dependent oxidoreductase n=1 Tax=Geodermatophilus amargosae TaxID=1296565 RepID=UPI0034DEDFF3